MKKAFITGVIGQDGSYLAEFLLEKGYDVHGMIRRSSTDYRERIAHLESKPHFHLHYGHMGDSMSLIQIINKVRPDEIYNLAAQSHVQVSFDSPEFTADVEYTTDDCLTDDDIRQYLRGHWHLEHPTDLQKKEKMERNEILIEAIQYGAPLRQLSD